jgi:hypothetical protein
VVLGDFSTPHHQQVGHPTKINKEILELNHTIDQMDLADVYRIFPPTSAQLNSSQQLMELFPKLIIY